MIELIEGDAFRPRELVATRPIDLVVADPPYGGIVSDRWDKVGPIQLAELLTTMAEQLASVCSPGAHLCIWGGFGTPGNRAFFRSIIGIETHTPWQMASLITWRKKRAYGTKWRCLAAREEMARFVLGDIRKPRIFNVPLSTERRGYAGFNAKHPAKSEFKRLTMVWDHASDMGQNKPHKCFKPEPLARTIVGMCTDPGDTVLDLFAGSGEVSRVAVEMGRRAIAVENDPDQFKRLCARLA